MTVPTELNVGGVRPLRGRLRVPGDKSISHRALLFAALAEGTSKISHLASGEDVGATRAALEALGVRVRVGNGVVSVGGAGVASWREPDAVVDCGNSGTTMRVLTGALAGRPFLTVMTGDNSLRQRPMRRVAIPLQAMGAHIDGRDDGEHAPLAIRGGELRGIEYPLPVASAQVKTAIVMAGLQARGETTIVSPAPSRDHTERMLGALGAPLEVDGLTLRVRAGAPRPFDIDVPGDPSSAAFFAVGAAITPSSDIVLEDVSCNPTRIGFVDVLARMGADIELRTTGEVCGEPVGELHVRSSALHATTIAGEEVPNVIDEIPVLAIAAAFAEGVTDIRDAAELVVKESNRIGALQEELTQLGLAVEARPDGLSIRGGPPRVTSVLFRSHNDHRVAMAAAVAGNAIDGASTVRGWQAVASSYPEFADDLAALTGSDA
jgi:3-phosphoshikimate 1-carboxyvinyltransferase